MKFGDHIKVKLGSFFHHGIYVSDKEVIHFCSEGKFSILSKNLEIQATSIEVFSQGNPVEIVNYTKRNSRVETVRLARESIGSADYDLSYNNCEHFVSRCILGENKSETIEKLFNRVSKIKTNHGINGFLYNLDKVLRKEG